RWRRFPPRIRGSGSGLSRMGIRVAPPATGRVESMKSILTFTIAACFVATAAYAALSKDEVKRLSEGAAILTELRESPDKGIPEELWKRAECILVIPSVKKAAFIVGGEYGSGVMSCRTRTAWSNPVFMQLAKGSLGLQIGGQQTDLVLLVMNRRG